MHGGRAGEGRMARALRPPRQWLDRPDEHWCCGYVLAINGATSTIRLQRHPSVRLTMNVSTSSLPCTDQYAPLAACFDDAGALIKLDHRVHWDPLDGPGSDETRAFTEREYFPVLSRDITGEPVFWEA
jgi:hypothetical protein